MSSDRTKQICLWMTIYIYIYFIGPMKKIESKIIEKIPFHLTFIHYLYINISLKYIVLWHIYTNYHFGRMFGGQSNFVEFQL